MKISASKKQLAKIISENGGWREGAEWSAQDHFSWGCHNLIVFYTEMPETPKGEQRYWSGENMGIRTSVCVDELLPKWSETILSRDEYFHLHPAQDVDGWIEHDGSAMPVSAGMMIDFINSNGGGRYVKASEIDWGDVEKYRKSTHDEASVSATPTIEQLAAEYRNRRDYAERKQQEADEAKAEAEAKLAELVAAGKAVGLAVSVAAPEPEMVITDWRDLLVGDVVVITSVFGRDNSGYEHLIDREAVVVAVGNTEFQELVVDRHGIEVHVDGFRFIRRPSKEADNA